MKTVKDGKQFPVTVTEGGVSAKIRKTNQTVENSTLNDEISIGISSNDPGPFANLNGNWSVSSDLNEAPQMTTSIDFGVGAGEFAGGGGQIYFDKGYRCVILCLLEEQKQIYNSIKANEFKIQSIRF